eukprot:15366879-Ditylum_brightwellii.AAC.1
MPKCKGRSSRGRKHDRVLRAKKKSTQEVENAVEANRPDIVVLYKKECKALTIDVTIPMDIKIIKAAA